LQPERSPDARLHFVQLQSDALPFQANSVTIARMRENPPGSMGHNNTRKNFK